MHVHVTAPDGEAKFWIEPRIESAVSHGLNQRQLNSIQRLVEAHVDEIRVAWRTHFES